MKSESALILKELAWRTGETMAVESAILAEKFGIPERSIRLAINELRRLGHPICSGPHGYYWAENTEEQKATLEHLKARAFDMLRTVSIQERIPARELAGQLTIALEGHNESAIL